MPTHRLKWGDEQDRTERLAEEAIWWRRTANLRSMVL